MNGSSHAIFVSYRRSDAEGEAGRLFDDLVEHFGEREVFMDVAAIAPGRDFRKAIDESVTACGALLALIGPTWLTATGENGQRRLDNSADFVRLEIAGALKRDIPVVPVLVRGATMPVEDDLPADLRDLAYRNAVQLTHARWKRDIIVLLDALRETLDFQGQSRAPAAASTAAPVTPSSVTPVAAVAAPVLEAAEVSRIARELASYIGPIADIVVKRAARRSATPKDLYDAVAVEIENESDRRAFLAKLPR